MQLPPHVVQDINNRMATLLGQAVMDKVLMEAQVQHALEENSALGAKLTALEAQNSQLKHALANHEMAGQLRAKHD